MGGYVPYRRAYHVERKYGLTPTELDALYEAQGHACAICGTPEAELARV